MKSVWLPFYSLAGVDKPKGVSVKESFNRIPSTPWFSCEFGTSSPPSVHLAYEAIGTPCTALELLTGLN